MSWVVLPALSGGHAVPAHSCGPPPGPSPVAPSAAPIGTAKPMPDQESSLPGSAIETTTPTTAPWLLISGPPELPGLTAASNWMSPLSFPASVLAVRCRPETTPVVVLSARPNWLPMATTSDPTVTPPPRVAGTTTSGRSAGVSRAMSTDLSEEATAAVVDDVVGGHDGAGVGDDEAGAERPFLGGDDHNRGHELPVDVGGGERVRRGGTGLGGRRDRPVRCIGVVGAQAECQNRDHQDSDRGDRCGCGDPAPGVESAVRRLGYGRGRLRHRVAGAGRCCRRGRVDTEAAGLGPDRPQGGSRRAVSGWDRRGRPQARPPAGATGVGRHAGVGLVVHASTVVTLPEREPRMSHPGGTSGGRTPFRRPGR